MPYEDEPRPQVEGPNPRPRPDEFDDSTINYADGFPDVPEPQWLRDEAKRMANERARHTHLSNQQRSAAYAIRRFGVEHPRAK